MTEPELIEATPAELFIDLTASRDVSLGTEDDDLYQQALRRAHHGGVGA